MFSKRRRLWLVAAVLLLRLAALQALRLVLFLAPWHRKWPRSRCSNWLGPLLPVALGRLPKKWTLALSVRLRPRWLAALLVLDWRVLVEQGLQHRRASQQTKRQQSAQVST